MSDIFISYSKSDRAKAQMLAKALERERWSVWWDPKIPPGKSFDEVIQQALDSARCVVVLWSKKSVISDWVKTEAEEGKRRGILIPALIEDDVRIPLDFRRLHAARLADWNGEGSGHLEFEELKNTVGELLGGATGVAQKRLEAVSRRRSGGPKTARIPLNEKVSELVQADHKKQPSQTIDRAARVFLFVLAGIAAVLFMRYAWIHWVKGPANEAEMPQVSKAEPAKNQTGGSQGKTTQAEPEELDKKLSSVYLDPATRLIWTKSDNGHNVTWSQANKYCQNLRLGGYSDWRLPTLEELEKLYDPKAGDGCQIRGPFKLTGLHVWSSTKRDSYSVWGFGFASGGRLLNVLNASDSMRALCVRGPGE